MPQICPAGPQATPRLNCRHLKYCQFHQSAFSRGLLCEQTCDEWVFESLRIELEGTSVSVTIVAPDFVQTEIFSRSLGADGQSLGFPLQDYEAFLSSEVCTEIISNAMAGRKRLVITTLRGKLGRWVKLCFAQIIDWMAKRGVDEAMRK